MTRLDLCHLGEQCGPGIIIDDILNIHKKCLFMLGVYEFNYIVNFLQDNQFEKIYKKKHLIIQGNDVYHNLYHFVFNHEYVIKDSELSNYNLVKERFNVKINNFRETLSSNDNCVFITFSDNINKLNITDMLNWLSNNKPNFHLMIFTNNSYNVNINSNKLSLIKLDNSYNEWWNMNISQKNIVYNEIYNKFLNCLKSNNITHDFPETFNETHYVKEKNG